MDKDKEQVFITAPGFEPLPLEETLEILVSKYAELKNQLESLQRDKAELIEVLSWYADGRKYRTDSDTPILDDGGARARTAIARLSRMKGDNP